MQVQGASVGPGPGLASSAFRPEYCRTSSPEVHTLEGAVLEQYDLKLLQTIFRHGDRVPSTSNGFCWAGESPFRCSSHQASVGLAIAPLARDYISSLAAAEEALRAPRATRPASSPVLHPLLLTARDVDEASARTADSPAWRALLRSRHRGAAAVEEARAGARTGARRLFALSSSAADAAADTAAAAAAETDAAAVAALTATAASSGSVSGLLSALVHVQPSRTNSGPRSRGFVEALLSAHTAEIHASASAAAAPDTGNDSSDASSSGAFSSLWVPEPVPQGVDLAVSDEFASSAAAAAARPAPAAPVFLSPFSSASAGPAPLAMSKRYVEGWGVWPGSCHVGALTVKGHAQLWALGQALRRAYGPALGLSTAADLTAESLYARSTDFPRTVQSLQGMLTGFVQTVPAAIPGGAAAPTGAEGTAMLPLARVSAVLNRVPIHTTDLGTDTMTPNQHACPVLNALKREARAGAEWLGHSADVGAALEARIQRAFSDPDEEDSDAQVHAHGTGKTMGGRVVGSPGALFDCAGSHICIGNPVPDGLTPDLFQELEDEVVWAERAYLSYPSRVTAAQLGIGAFLSQVAAMQLRQALARAALVPDLSALPGRRGREQAALSGGTAGPWLRSTRFAAFSGHDTTLTAVLVALGVFDDKWPPYASHAEIEVFRRASDSVADLLHPKTGALILDGQPTTAAAAAAAATAASAAGVPALGAKLAAAETALRAEVARRDARAAAALSGTTGAATGSEPVLSGAAYSALGQTLGAAVSPAQRARVRRLIGWFHTRTTVHPSTEDDAGADAHTADEAVSADARAGRLDFEPRRWLASWLHDEGRLSLAALELARYRVRVVYNGDILTLPFCAPAPNDVPAAASSSSSSRRSKDQYADFADAYAHPAGPGASRGFGLCPLAQWLDALTELAPRRRAFSTSAAGQAQQHGHHSAARGWNGHAASRTAAAEFSDMAALEHAAESWTGEGVMGYGREASQFDFRCGIPEFMSS